MKAYRTVNGELQLEDEVQRLQHLLDMRVSVASTGESCEGKPVGALIDDDQHLATTHLGLHLHSSTNWS